LSESARLSNTNLGQKKKGYERFTLVNIVKKNRPQISLSPFRYKRIGCSLKTIEIIPKKWQSNKFLQSDAFFGDQGPSMQTKPSKTHTQKNIEIKHLGKIYIGTKCGGAAKSWLV